MARSNDDGVKKVRLSKRRRLTATNDATHAVETTVHCPVKQGAEALVRCRVCARYRLEGLGGGHEYLECEVPASTQAPQTLAGELLSAEVTCLDCELEAARAVEVMAMAGVTSAPVLDDNAVLIGVVSSGALARLQLEQRQVDGFGPGDVIEVEDAMSTQVVTLSERASLGEAARVMAARGLDRLPIVRDDGHLVGVLSAMDLVRWLAGWAP